MEMVFMRGVYIGNHRMLVSPIWGGKLIVSSDDRSLMPDLVINGYYDIALTKYLIKQIKPGNITVDVGANVGYFTTLMGYLVGPSGKVISYEADLDNFLLIYENIAVNYLNDRVMVMNKAVYSENTTISFYATEKFKGNGSIHKHDDQYFRYFGNEKIIEQKIEAESLDSSLIKFDSIDIVKIDIEGGEYHALLGMKTLIEEEKITCIIFELNKSMLREDFTKLRDLIEGWDEHYYFFFLTNEGDEVPVSVEEIFNHDSIPAVGMKKRIIRERG